MRPLAMRHRPSARSRPPRRLTLWGRELRHVHATAISWEARPRGGRRWRPAARRRRRRGPHPRRRGRACGTPQGRPRLVTFVRSKSPDGGLSNALPRAYLATGTRAALRAQPRVRCPNSGDHENAMMFPRSSSEAGAAAVPSSPLPCNAAARRASTAAAASPEIWVVTRGPPGRTAHPPRESGWSSSSSSSSSRSGIR
jgi:hypothetical protein